MSLGDIIGAGKNIPAWKGKRGGGSARWSADLGTWLIRPLAGGGMVRGR